MEGMAPQLTKALEDLKTQKTIWDTTNLENSFDYFGRTMHEVLRAKQRTSQIYVMTDISRSTHFPKEI